MLTTWVDVIARVRGLSSRLMGRALLERLSASRDFAALVEGMHGTAYARLADVNAPSGRSLERETRRVAAARLETIAAWCGDRVNVLAPLLEDEDRRNLRALSRGVAAHEPPDQSVAGLLPTPALSSEALEELARSSRLADLAATLTAWGNPYGPAMLPEAILATPNLFALQLAIDRAYAARAVAIAPRAGDAMVRYVRMVIDAGNATTVLAVSRGIVEHELKSLFIPGGDLLSEARFTELARRSLTDTREHLARLLAGTPLASIVVRTGDSSDARMLTAQLRELRRTVRQNPLSIVVVLEYVLALRAELQDLARIVWGITLQVPRRRIAERLVTP